MSLTKSLCLITGAALSLSGVALAQSSDLDLSRSVASELKADALSRTSNLAPADQKFTVDVHGYLQFRYVWNHRSSSDPVLAPNDNENAIGFQNARDRIDISGNIFNESWSYFVGFGWGPVSSGSSDAFIEDAWADYNFGNGWDLLWGKSKLPGMREELVGDTYQLAVERSTFNTTFSLGRADMVQLGYETQQMRLKFAFSDGAHTNATDFDSGSEADYAFTARFEYKWQGDWKQANDFTSFQQSPYFGMFGIAGHYQSGGDTFATADVKAFELMGDVSVEGDGWNVFGAVAYRHTDPNGGTKTDDWGFMAQGGIFLGNPNWELFGRYELIIPDSAYSPNDNDFSVFTVGVNDYIMQNSHAAKFTVELEWFVDNTNGTAIVSPNTLSGLLQSGKNGQYALTAQMQIVF